MTRWTIEIKLQQPCIFHIWQNSKVWLVYLTGPTLIFLNYTLKFFYKTGSLIGQLDYVIIMSIGQTCLFCSFWLLRPSDIGTCQCPIKHDAKDPGAMYIIYSYPLEVLTLYNEVMEMSKTRIWNTPYTYIDILIFFISKTFWI